MDARAIRGVVIQKQEILKYLQHEITQLSEKKNEIEKDLIDLGDALKPHNHYVLPNEILGRVFVLVAQDYGRVVFPIQAGDAPPQLSISHVCSHWRRVALRTPELWCNTRLILSEAENAKMYRTIGFHQRWLLRAGRSPVSISIDFCPEIRYDHPAYILKKVLMPLQVKELHLSLTHAKLMDLSRATLPGITELALDLIVPSGWGSVDDLSIGNSHHLIPQLRSIVVLGDEVDDWVRSNFQNISWNQLRSLEFNTFTGDLQLILNILPQIPMIQALKLIIYRFDLKSVENLTMPYLREFFLEIVEDAYPMDEELIHEILCCFTCPSLTNFTLRYATFCWAEGTLETLQQQYNMERLQELNIFGDIGLPVSYILQSAPLLRSFSTRWDAILDDEAIIGISNGTLARHLRSLDINVTHDVGEVLGMVEARKKTVDKLFEKGCNWREAVTILRNVVIRQRDGNRGDEYDERVNLLKGVGITIEFKE